MPRGPINLSRSEQNIPSSVNPNDSTFNASLSSQISVTSRQDLPQSVFQFSDMNLNAASEIQDDVYNRNSVVQSIWMIMGIQRETRWWRPTYGSNIEPLLFEPVDRVTSDQLRNRILSGLQDPINGEPRAIVRNVEVIPDPNGNQFFVNLVIDVPSLGLFNDNLNFGLRAQ